MIKTLNALVYFPVNILNEGKRITEVNLDYKNSVSYKTTNAEIVTTDFKKQSLLIEKGKFIRLTKQYIQKDDNYNQAISLAVNEVEAFISWLSFLTLEEFRIVYWGEISSQLEYNKISVSLKSDIPIDPYPSVNKTFGAHRSFIINPPIIIPSFENWISIIIPKELYISLRWYRKGLISIFPEEKFIFWVAALENLSGLIKDDGYKVIKCEKEDCNFEKLVKKSNIDALKSFVKKELGFSIERTYGVIQSFRSKYAHGASGDFNYFDSNKTTVINATKSLLILFLINCFHLSSKKKASLEHPLKGDVSYLLHDIKKLSDLGLHKK